MVPREELEELFRYEDGKIYGKWVEWRRKASNTRVFDKPIGCDNGDKHMIARFKDKRGKQHSELVHRIIYMMHHGHVPPMLDHVDRDPKNNRIENLRPADKSLNSQNRGAQKNTKHGLRGIHKDKLGGYCVYIGIDKKRHHIGRTVCLGQAWRMRKDAEAKYWPDV